MSVLFDIFNDLELNNLVVVTQNNANVLLAMNTMCFTGYNLNNLLSRAKY